MRIAGWPRTAWLPALAALCLTVGGCSAPSAPRVVPTSVTSSPSPTPRPTHRHHGLTARQRAAVRRWAANGGSARLAALAGQEHAILAALRAHDVYGAFDHCQPLQESIEHAQEARPIPAGPVNDRWQNALARLATATTRCLNGVGHGDHTDLARARVLGAAGLARLLAVRRALAH